MANGGGRIRGVGQGEERASSAVRVWVQNRDERGEAGVC